MWTRPQDARAISFASPAWRDGKLVLVEPNAFTRIGKVVQMEVAARLVEELHPDTDLHPIPLPVFAGRS